MCTLSYSALQPVSCVPFLDAESTVYAFQMMLSKFEYDGQLNPNFKEGPFSLTISSIEAYTTATTGARYKYITAEATSANQNEHRSPCVLTRQLPRMLVSYPHPSSVVGLFVSPGWCTSARRA